MKIYPEIDVLEFDEKITFGTNVRKLNDEGKYFFCQFYKTFYKTTPLKDCLTSFLFEIYWFQKFGKYTDKFIDPLSGQSLYPIDKNQISEEQRLKQLMS